jgi:hypothetical protein
MIATPSSSLLTTNGSVPALPLAHDHDHAALPGLVLRQPPVLAIGLVVADDARAAKRSLA